MPKISKVIKFEGREKVNSMLLKIFSYTNMIITKVVKLLLNIEQYSTDIAKWFEGITPLLKGQVRK